MLPHHSSVRAYKLSKDGVATINVIGDGPKGAKSSNLIVKAHLLEDCGFLFPRRNLVIKQSLLLEGLRTSGLKDSWDTIPIPFDRNFRPARERFIDWVANTIWPLVEDIFEGRAFFVRSNAPGDSLGRGVYSSIPFVNSYRTSTSDPSARSRSFAIQLLEVVESYFSETAAKFREKSGIEENGINVLLCQFIGRPSGIGSGSRILLPFMSTMVKSTLFHGKPDDGLIRFEYGLGKGAISGRSLLFHQGSDSVQFETICGDTRSQGINCSAHQINAFAVDVDTNMEVQFDGSHWGIFSASISSAYPIAGGKFEACAHALLDQLAHSVKPLERMNGGPAYLELAVSSFRNELRWFVVQAADFDPIHQLANPPGIGVDFVSNDFCGHGFVEGNKRIFIIGKEYIKNSDWKVRLREINQTYSDFVILVPQQALTGLDLTQLSGGHFSNAAAVLEYRTLGSYRFATSVHIEGPPSEHFEQVMRDFDVLFMPVKNIFSDEDAARISPTAITEGTADVVFACDRERGFAWGKIRNLTLV